MEDLRGGEREKREREEERERKEERGKKIEREKVKRVREWERE